MPKYTVVLLRHEDMGGEAYIGYVEAEGYSAAITKAQTEVFKADKKDGLHEELFIQPTLMDYRIVAVFEDHAKITYIP